MIIVAIGFELECGIKQKIIGDRGIVIYDYGSNAINEEWNLCFERDSSLRCKKNNFTPVEIKSPIMFSEKDILGTTSKIKTIFDNNIENMEMNDSMGFHIHMTYWTDQKKDRLFKENKMLLDKKEITKLNPVICGYPFYRALISTFRSTLAEIQTKSQKAAFDNQYFRDHARQVDEKTFSLMREKYREFALNSLGTLEYRSSNLMGMDNFTYLEKYLLLFYKCASVAIEEEIKSQKLFSSDIAPNLKKLEFVLPKPRHEQLKIKKIISDTVSVIKIKPVTALAEHNPVYLETKKPHVRLNQSRVLTLKKRIENV